MGTLLALVAVVCAVGGPVAAIKPSLVGQSSRFKALVFCWVLAAISMLFGMAFDGRLGWGEVAAYSAVLLGLYVLLTYISASVRVARMSPEERARKLAELRGQPTQPLSTTSAKSKYLQAFEDTFTVMWAGDTKPVEFTYLDSNGERTRRTVEVEEVAFNPKGQFYLRGVCQLRGEHRTFKVDHIQTKLKVGSNRYDFEEWCVEMLDILPSEGFPKAYFDRYDS
ncbi:WYL domain-containing protein [Aeromonas caviae]|uniref:WYL domain-containing protein n=1 Tax=Aeromonas caviae TaxID=648 RepID=UPI0038D1C0FC